MKLQDKIILLIIFWNLRIIIHMIQIEINNYKTSFIVNNLLVINFFYAKLNIYISFSNKDSEKGNIMNYIDNNLRNYN